MKSVKTESQITSIIWSNHYTELLTTHGYSTNDINVWKFPTMDRISNIKAHDSRILYSGKYILKKILKKKEKKKKKKYLYIYNYYNYIVALSPDGQTVATVSSDENLKFWSIFKQQSKRSYNIAFTPESSKNTIHKSVNSNKKNHLR